MTYPSSGYQRSWGYDIDADDFDAKLGRLLCGGPDLKASMRASALASVGHMAELEKQQADKGFSTTPPPGSALLQTSTSGRGATPVDEGTYFMVDGKGNTLKSSRTGTPMMPTSPSATQQQQQQQQQKGGPSEFDPMALTGTQAAYASMRPNERTCHQWRRINPGCMEYTTSMPTTSMKDHYQYNPAKIEPVDHRHHAKKTDFSDYTEAKVIMNRLTTH